MANHNLPTLTSTYVNFRAELDGRLVDLAQGLDPAVTAVTNPPANAIRWSSAANLWQRWNGTSWVNLTATYAISISGSAATLTTGRTINGTSFDGSANITTANWGTARTLTIGATGKSVNGSANVSWTLAEIGAAEASATVNLTGDQTIGGVKTFSSQIVGATNSQVSLTGDQTIDGVKRFSQPPRWGADGSRGIPLPSGTDLNTITDAGWYDVHNAVNAPAGTADWIHLTVSRGHTPLWVLQTAADFHSDRIWFRLSRDGGGGAAAWQPWVEMLHRGNGVALSGDQTIGGVKSFSSQVNGKTSGTDTIPAFSAATTGGAYATMWDRRGVPFHSFAETEGSSYAPALSHRYAHNYGWVGVYSVGVLNHAAASPGSFVIHHLSSNAANDLAWRFNGGTGEFISPGSITAPSITVGSLPTFQCRAWVNFNGTGTVAIRASGNVSSITDNGVGDYTLNFVTAMPDANYLTCYGVNANSTSSNFQATTAALSIGSPASLKTATQLRITVGQTNAAALSDATEINVAIFR